MLSVILLVPFISSSIPTILAKANRYEAELESTTRWEPIRILFDIEIEDEEKKSILKQTTDSINDYLKKLLKVHPCKLLKINQGDDFTEKTYNDIDFYVLIKSLPVGDEAAASTQAYTDYNNDHRPKVALIKVGLQNINKASTINDSPRDLFEILIHEVFHALGIAEGQFQYWIEPESNTQYIYLGKNPVHNCTFSDYKRESYYVTTPNIKEFIKRKYGDDNFGLMPNGEICEAGIELENNGGEGSKYKHPESRVYPYEIMSAFHTSGKIHSISDLTLTLLNSSGYYEVNFDLAEPYSFGYPESNSGEKINKFLYGIPAKTWPEQYQCDPERYGIPNTSISFRVCNPDLRSTGQCRRYKYMCPRDAEICSSLDFIDPYETGYSGATQSFDYIAFPEPLDPCSKALTSDIDYIRYGSTVGEDSVCLISNARNQESGWTNPEMLAGRCFRIECDEKFTKYTVTVADGEKATCTKKGQKLTFPNSRYKYGYIECNDPYWTCYAKNNHHSFDDVPPEDEVTDDSPGGDDQKPSDDESSAGTMTPVIQTVEPEPTPEPAPGPTVDSNSSPAPNKIKLTSSGYIVDGEEIDTTHLGADLILIKTSGFKFSVSVDTENGPTQKRYISPVESQEITIEAPTAGDFGAGQIGVHANEHKPPVKIPAAKVPLNFYSNESSLISISIPGSFSEDDSKDEEEVATYSFGSIISSGGQFLLSVPLGITRIEFKEITVFLDASYDSVSGYYSTPITTAVDDFILSQGSSMNISRVAVNSKLKAGQNAKLRVGFQATFGDESVVELSHLSSIDFGDSIVEGVCKSVSVHLDSNLQSSGLLEAAEEKVICGSNFDCDAWLRSFTPSNDFDQAKCSNQCLMAIRKAEKGPDDGDGGNKNKNKKAVIIAVVVVVVVVVIAAVVVAVIFIMKKRNSPASTQLGDTTNQTNDDMGI